MAYNDKKILHVLRDEINKIPKRCNGYDEDIAHLLGDVLNLERKNTITRIDIVKKIADLIHTVGMGLHKNRSGSTTNGDTQ